MNIYNKQVSTLRIQTQLFSTLNNLFSQTYTISYITIHYIIINNNYKHTPYNYTYWSFIKAFSQFDTNIHEHTNTHY